MAVKKPKSRLEDLVVQETNGEVLIYDLRTNKAFCLNETSGLIWKACDGTRDVDGIRKYLHEKTQSDASEDLIWFALNQLKKEKLLETIPDDASRFSGMSRREVIKRIGVGSAVALPVIAGLVAPPAYAQASACNVGTVCTCTISGMDAGGAGNACAPANTGGCSSGAGCTCLATSSGNPVTPGTCGIPA